MFYSFFWKKLLRTYLFINIQIILQLSIYSLICQLFGKVFYSCIYLFNLPLVHSDFLLFRQHFSIRYNVISAKSELCVLVRHQAICLEQFVSSNNFFLGSHLSNHNSVTGDLNSTVTLSTTFEQHENTVYEEDPLSLNNTLTENPHGKTFNTTTDTLVTSPINGLGSISIRKYDQDDQENSAGLYSLNNMVVKERLTHNATFSTADRDRSEFPIQEMAKNKSFDATFGTDTYKTVKINKDKSNADDLNSTFAVVEGHAHDVTFNAMGVKNKDVTFIPTYASDVTSVKNLSDTFVAETYVRGQDTVVRSPKNRFSFVESNKRAEETVEVVRRGKRDSIISGSSSDSLDYLSSLSNSSSSRGSNKMLDAMENNPEQCK